MADSFFPITDSNECFLVVNQTRYRVNVSIRRAQRTLGNDVRFSLCFNVIERCWWIERSAGEKTSQFKIVVGVNLNRGMFENGSVIRCRYLIEMLKVQIAKLKVFHRPFPLTLPRPRRGSLKSLKNRGAWKIKRRKRRKEKKERNYTGSRRICRIAR